MSDLKKIKKKLRCVDRGKMLFFRCLDVREMKNKNLGFHKMNDFFKSLTPPYDRKILQLKNHKM